ncbi:MAG TPA: FAD-dependent oxidoreductase [Candidatus Paceibacterota bacterium]
MYDLIIAGGGPGGIAAGVYSARKKMKTLLITDSFGGQSFVSADIQNWIGTKSVSGFEFAQMMEGHLRAQEDIEIIDDDRISLVEKKGDNFVITTNKGNKLETKTFLVTTGSKRKKLNIPGEKEFDGRGVAYCATCDAPIFKNKVVAVVGGGNAGLEAVIDLLPYASKIYLMEYGDALKGDLLTQGKIKSNPKVEILLHAKTTKISGDNMVTGLEYEDLKEKVTKKLELGGVFVEIGSIPNTDFLNGLVELNKFGEIIVDHKTQRSSLTGIWAAGDATDVLYKQNNISAGDAVKAVLNIHDYLNK